LRIYLYEFKSNDPASIALKKCADYELRPRCSACLTNTGTLCSSTMC